VVSQVVDVEHVSTAGLESSPVPEALTGTIRGSLLVIEGEY